MAKRGKLVPTTRGGRRKEEGRGGGGGGGGREREKWISNFGKRKRKICVI